MTRPHFYADGLCTREEVRTVACPVCRVNPGEKCVSHVGVPRESNHQARLDVFKKTKR